jgi:hypothetical protein
MQEHQSTPSRPAASISTLVLVRLLSGRLDIVIVQTSPTLYTFIADELCVFDNIRRDNHSENDKLKKSQVSIAGAEGPAQWGSDLKQVTGF